MIQVVGHKNPDSDSICSALVATELLKARGLEAKPVRQGELNRETQYILEQAGVEQPEMCTGVAGQKIWLVDYTDVSQAPDDIADAEIVGIVDHHRLGDVMTVNPLEAWIGLLVVLVRFCLIYLKWKKQKSRSHMRFL